MTDGFHPYYKGGQGAESKREALLGKQKELLLVGVNGSLSAGKGINLFSFGPFGIGKGAQGLTINGINPFGIGADIPVNVHKK